ncbi:hypothetical protein IMSAG013_01428 [Clostridiales bacterium]|nr:hypothetical protein IMSAG013_01428 [Clostridiales bacterium]
MIHKPEHIIGDANGSDFLQAMIHNPTGRINGAVYIERIRVHKHSCKKQRIIGIQRLDLFVRIYRIFFILIVYRCKILFCNIEVPYKCKHAIFLRVGLTVNPERIHPCLKRTFTRHISKTLFNHVETNCIFTFCIHPVYTAARTFLRRRVFCTCNVCGCIIVYSFL